MITLVFPGNTITWSRSCLFQANLLFVFVEKEETIPLIPYTCFIIILNRANRPISCLLLALIDYGFLGLHWEISFSLMTLFNAQSNKPDIESLFHFRVQESKLKINRSLKAQASFMWKIRSYWFRDKRLCLKNVQEISWIINGSYRMHLDELSVNESSTVD